MSNDQSPSAELPIHKFLPFGTAWGVEVLLRGAGNCQRIFDEAEELTLPERPPRRGRRYGSE
jgi:hypothetical protein